jgi:hypothetical protein
VRDEHTVPEKLRELLHSLGEIRIRYKARTSLARIHQDERPDRE